MDVVATVETLWASKQYSRAILPRVEDYSVDSAMDTDADQFTITLGDPEAELMSIFRRDGEVRVQLSASYNNGRTFVPLLRGYADTIGFVHDGTLSLTGRDLSAAAIDDTALPWSWVAARPGRIIQSQARQRGMARFGGLLRHPNAIGTLSQVFTDGSETVWAFWYRMVRNKKMWIWVGSEGTLFVDRLHYSNNPSYLFGWPSSNYPQYGNANQWIPVQEAEEQKNTQTRLWGVWVYADNGKVSFPPVKVHDPKIDHWIKKPVQIIPAKAGVTNPAEATKEAFEEIFEGMVGEIEILIRITDPGFIVQQNRIAVLNIPKMNLSGEFFVVGNKISSSSTGAIQEIRLREKKYALTKRIPTDPVMADGSQNLNNSSMGAALGLSGSLGTFFVNAAKLYHGPWDFSLFLATLLAICQTESSFRNVREGGGPDWYPAPVSPEPSGLKALESWQRDFANSQNNRLNPFYPNREAGVGYMQLTDLSLKIHADRLVGKVDEYAGGRWDAQSNITTGAMTLSEKLRGLPTTETDFWVGVQGYNGWVTGKPEQGPYSDKIKALVNSTYLKQVTAAEATPGVANSDPLHTQYAYNGFMPDQIKRIIHTAEQQIGKRYVNAGSGPDVFDCSGLVYYCYKAAGLDSAIGGRESTYGYWGNTDGPARNHLELVYVAVDGLSPGDMVFFHIVGERSYPSHMGIYYHDDQMIAAENTHLGVVQMPINREDGTLLGGMRVKGIWPTVVAPTHPGANS